MKRAAIAAAVLIAVSMIPAQASDVGTARVTYALTLGHKMKGYNITTFVYRLDRTSMSIDPLGVPQNGSDLIACFGANKSRSRRGGKIQEVTVHSGCGPVQFGFSEATWIANATGSINGYKYKVEIRKRSSGYTFKTTAAKPAPIIVNITWSGQGQPNVSPPPIPDTSDFDSAGTGVAMSRDATVSGTLNFRGIKKKMTYKEKPVGYLSDIVGAGATTLA